jgi:hypothetical protein
MGENTSIYRWPFLGCGMFLKCLSLDYSSRDSNKAVNIAVDFGIK